VQKHEFFRTKAEKAWENDFTGQYAVAWNRPGILLKKQRASMGNLEYSDFSSQQWLANIVNSLIKMVRVRRCGFPKKEHFRTGIYFKGDLP
jgi:hypothetical protein